MEQGPEFFPISSGGAQVLASGTVIAFDGKPLVFSLGNLKLIFDFIDEKDRHEPRAQNDLIEPSTLKLTLFNFNDPLGAGPSKPEALGGYRGRKLYLNYRVYPLAGGDKTLHYTFYLGEEAKRDE